jgi:hypothetical protein
MVTGFVEVFVCVHKIKEFQSNYTKFIIAIRPTDVSVWIIFIIIIMLQIVTNFALNTAIDNCLCVTYL